MSKVYNYLNNIEDEVAFANIINIPDKEFDNSKNKPITILTSKGEAPSKNSMVSKQALKQAEFKCEYDNTHITFKYKNNIQFMEGHHLIRCTKKYSDKYWNEYGVNIDMKENIVSLCPNCHRKIHYAEPIERNIMLEKLYDKKILSINEKGIKLTLDELKEIYENQNN